MVKNGKYLNRHEVEGLDINYIIKLMKKANGKTEYTKLYVYHNHEICQQDTYSIMMLFRFKNGMITHEEYEEYWNWLKILESY